ncbi:MAG: hypothetical protein V4753_08980 [Pseudomonadota bacterium]
MPTQVFDVLAQRTPIGWANLDDFDLGPASTAPDGIVIDQPGWTLYGLDDAHDHAIFTDLPPTPTLPTAPSPMPPSTAWRAAC